MRRKNELFLYTCMWVAAILILMVLLLQNLGDARVVNYSGIVRGATQKLVKEELSGQQDDELIVRLDGIIENLQTGRGKFKLQRNGDRAYQEKLAALKDTWELIKEEIGEVRTGAHSGDRLFALSQQHFAEADQMVLLAENASENKLYRFIGVYVAVLFVSVFIFMLLSRRNRRALEYSIYTDNLTGICNQAGFEERAAALLRQHNQTRYCLLEFDIDDFKFLNNTYGYDFGNRLLCALAGRLRQEFCGDQCCARISADDFVVLARQDLQAVQRLRGLLAEPLLQQEFRSVCEFVTFTVGAYEVVGQNEEIQRMMDKANMAHKSAKVQGKAVTVWYNETLLERLNQENRLTNRMRRALEDQEFKMYLQPKYDMENCSVHSAEALARWEFPGQGLVPPDCFIPLFERNSSIALLDYYILERACAYIRRQIDSAGEEFSIAVNFSRVTLYQQDFSSKILEIVDCCQIPRHCIEIEITESAFNEISDVMIQKLLYLQKEGFTVSMDDFGSGYSNLNSLGKMPIQVLKLDREFLRSSGLSDKAQNVIACVTELAHRLDLKVICEGVETKDQMEFLKSVGCDYGQGYYFARPMPEEEFRRKYGTVK